MCREAERQKRRHKNKIEQKRFTNLKEWRYSSWSTSFCRSEDDLSLLYSLHFVAQNFSSIETDTLSLPMDTHTLKGTHRQTFFPHFISQFYFKMKIKMKQIKWFVYAFPFLSSTYVQSFGCKCFVSKAHKHTHISCMHIYCVWLESNLFAISSSSPLSLFHVWCHFNAGVTTKIRIRSYKVYVMTLDNLIFQVNAARNVNVSNVDTKWKCCNLKQQQQQQWKRNISDFYFIIHTINGCFLFPF